MNQGDVIQTIPAYPYAYPKNLDCTWLITADDGGFIILRFVFFRLVTNWDFLSIGYGHNVSKDTIVSILTGAAAPNTVTMNGTSAWMKLTTPAGGSFGFVIEVEVNNNKGK